MKPATEKKVKEILARAKSLKSCFVREIRALSEKEAKPEDKEIPRPSAIIIREGLWLVKIANKFIDRHDITLSEKDADAVLKAKEFFDELAETHADELKRNEFIYRLPVQIILHLERIATMIVAFDANVKARIAQIEAEDVSDDAELQEEIEAEMIG